MVTVIASLMFVEVPVTLVKLAITLWKTGITLGVKAANVMLEDLSILCAVSHQVPASAETT